jgi:hypothetical protein
MVFIPLCICLPFSALFYTLAVIALFLVIGKLIEQITWKLGALPTMLMIFVLATVFYRAGITPKGFGNVYATATVHFLPVATLTA